VLIDLIVISFVASLVWGLIDRVERTNALWSVPLAGILTLELHAGVYLYSRDWLDYSYPTWAALGGILIVLALCLRSWSRRWFEGAVRTVSWSAVLWGFPLLFVLPELAYMAAVTSDHEEASFSRSTPGTATGPRICWILFDELSYDQIYDHRATGLELPSFDRLYGESKVFSNVQPAGDYTDIAIPSMLLGRPASQMKSSVVGNLNLFMDDTRRWERFDASKTIFAHARRLGWTSAIVGWANPYCRLMADWVDECYWLPEDDPVIRETNMDPDRSLAYNMASIPLQWLHAALPDGELNGREYNGKWVALRERHYELAMERAKALIEESAIRFKFIHLPIPHPPAIFDRRTHTFSARGSYLDNLVLADAALGELLAKLEKTPEWPETTLIVSGDHSWRPWIWKRLGLWTAEDEAASKGRYDRRPLMTIHLPGEQHGYAVSSEFPAVSLNSVVRGMMGVRTSEDSTSHTAASFSNQARVRNSERLSTGTGPSIPGTGFASASKCPKQLNEGFKSNEIRLGASRL
jgi:hypothetical protein